MARKGNPISVRLDLNRSSDSSWFSDYYYGKLVYQDINLRSYFGSIRPPTRLTFGFRLGRCIIIHNQKKTFINFFLPRRPQRRKKSRPRKRKMKMKMKGRWWEFGKVGPIECLYSSEGRKEERNEVRGRRAGKRVESIRLDDQKKQNEIRAWPKKKQRYGYHDRSPSIKILLSKAFRVSRAKKHPKYAEGVNDIAFLIDNDSSFRKTKLFKFFLPKEVRYNGPASRLVKRILSRPRMQPFLKYSVRQYLLNTKNKMNFDPVLVLNHFVAPGVLEPSTTKRANTQERSLDKRIRSRIAFFVESSTSEKKCLAEAKKFSVYFSGVCLLGLICYFLFDLTFLNPFFFQLGIAFLCRILGWCFGLTGVTLFLLKLPFRGLSVTPAESSTELEQIFLELFGRSPSEPPQSPLPSSDTAEPAGEEQPLRRPHEITREPYYRLLRVEQRLDSLLERRPEKIEDLAAWEEERNSLSAEAESAIKNLTHALEEEKARQSMQEEIWARQKEIFLRSEKFQQALIDEEKRRAWLSHFPPEVREQYELAREKEIQRRQSIEKKTKRDPL